MSPVEGIAHKRRPSVKWCPVTHEKFRIGVIVGSDTRRRDRIHALANPASSCRISKVVLLDPEADFDDWCRRYQVDVIHRCAGLDQLLSNLAIDGVYITGVFGNKTDIIEKALKAGKHVLADDPIATSVQDYCRLINLAHAQKKHLQDTTMFVYHHAVREFMSSILDVEKFGEIKKVDACFDINIKDARFHGITADERRGCIGDLCRYCAVLGVLIFQRSGRKALSAQVTTVKRDQDGLPAHCICRVKFEGDVSLTVDCSYITYAGTRQSVDVHSDSHSASMGDFVFSSHSLACFRLYEKCTIHGCQHVKQGDSIDVDGGPLQEVSVWRRFAELSTNAYIDGEMDDNLLFDRYDVTYSAVQSQNIVSALAESLMKGCEEVLLFDLEIPGK